MGKPSHDAVSASALTVSIGSTMIQLLELKGSHDVCVDSLRECWAF
jgi:hypothetical protein